MARAQNLAIGVAQGTQFGSGTQAAMGNAWSQGQENQQTSAASEIQGNRVFAANRRYFDATQRGQAGMALGAGISTLGGAIANNAGAFERVGTYMTSPRQTVPDSYYQTNPGLY